MSKIVKFGVVFFLFLGMGCTSQEDLGMNLVGPNTYDLYVYKPQKLINTYITNNTVVAHRGAYQLKKLPENSIASLKEAIRLKCKGSEFDIMLTADDSLVVAHGPTYNNLNIQESKYADLISLKFANGEKLPTFSEYISEAQKNNTTTKLVCEIKNYNLSNERKKLFVLKTLRTVQKFEAHQLMIYICFDYSILKQIRSIDSYANLQYLSGNVTPEELKADKITGADYHYDVFFNHKDWIDRAKAKGIELNVWTVGEAQFDFFLKNSFDYITTGQPELLLAKQN